jgi:hypothetical protein
VVNRSERETDHIPASGADTNLRLLSWVSRSFETVRVSDYLSVSASESRVSESRSI